MSFIHCLYTPHSSKRSALAKLTGTVSHPSLPAAGSYTYILHLGAGTTANHMILLIPLIV